MPRGRPRNVNLAMPEVPNNPQVQGPRIEMEFMRHNPPTFNGKGDPLTAERWIRALEKIFRFLQCTDKEMVTCGLYQLVDDADFWWESIRRTISEADWELFTWEDFKIILYQKYIPAHYQHQKANEFWNLKQGNKSVADYDLQFNRLSRYAPQTVDTEEKRIEKFRMGLKPEIGTALIGKDDTNYSQMLSWALSIEAMQGTSKASASQPAVGDQKGKRKEEGTLEQGNAAPKSQGYQGNSPQCVICSRHHFGPCVQCYRCGRQGHYANACPQNSSMQGQQQQQQRPQFRQTMRSTGPQGRGGRGNNNNNRSNPRPQQNQQGPRAPQQARAYALNQQETAGNPGNLTDNVVVMSPTVPQKKRRTIVALTAEVDTDDLHDVGEEILISASDGSESEEELDNVDAEVQIEKLRMKEVNDMGFGLLVHLGIEKVPTRIAYWVVDNFDARRSEINLQDGRRLHIEAADVYCVLGFPNGDRPIVRKKKFQQCKILDDWLGIFGSKRKSIVAKDVAQEMLKHIHGGEVFRRHFIVLVIVCLIETSSNGYIAPQILGCLGDLTRVKEFDWCGYVVKGLVEHKIMWEKNKKKNFSGPMLFLTAFYVDRVVLYSKTVVREFPTMKNWTHLLMKNRENAEIKSGRFGGGYPREPIPIVMGNNDAAILQNTPTVANFDIEGACSLVDMFAERFIQKAKLLAITMVEIIAMVEGAPQQLAGTTQLQKFLDASHQLLGIGNVGSCSTVEAHVQTQFIDTQADEDFWGNPDMITMIEEIESAMVKRNEFIKNLLDGPSFSLGLTQEDDAGLEYENEYFDFSLRDDDTEEVQFVRSGIQSRGIVINDNGNADGAIFDKQRLEKDRMEEHSYDSSRGESDQSKRKREIAKGDDTYDVMQDVEPFEDLTNLMSKEKEFVEPLPHQIERRNRANMKKTEKFMSPYVLRTIDISAKVSKLEKELWYWIFYNEEANDAGVAVNRGDMLTMRQNAVIRSNILDAWSSVMNHKELSRSPDSRYRFFASTKPACFEIENLNGSYDKKKVMDKFVRALDGVLKKTKGIKVANIELFVFPVYEMEHYQIVCFNVKNFRVDVIDDKVSSTDVDNSTSGGVPLLLVRLLL
ncbi:hypothetical protein C2S51_023119 [Perilla frutescens var. frutescens]|nr:hypothetical protein C2S51_023119 [Perilla frutescens var. frutescens]